MTKEDKYREELQTLGLWEDAFAPVVHDLCILEREQARARKAWKASSTNGLPDFESPIYQIIMKQSASIQTLRESLGLTPKSIRRFRTSFGSNPESDEKAPLSMLEIIQKKHNVS